MIELLLNAFTNPQPEAINNHFGVVESQPKTEITLNLPLYTKQKRAKFRNQIQNIQNKVGETVKHPIIETKIGRAHV